MRPRDLIALRPAVGFNGPLDNAAFDNTAAYYSIRHPGTGSALINTPAMDVQEHTGDTVLTILYISDGNGGAILDYASIVTHCGTGDGGVKKWYDPIGGFDVEQATKTNQPLICISGGALEAPLFDGVNDCLVHTAASPITSYGLGIFVWSSAKSFPSANNSVCSIADSVSTSDFFDLFYFPGSNIWRYQAINGGQNSIIAKTAAVADVQTEWKSCYAGSSADNAHAVNFDGGTESTGATTIDFPAVDDIAVGCKRNNAVNSNFWSGFISEVVISSADKTQAEYQTMDGLGRPNAKTTLLLDQSFADNAHYGESIRKIRDLYGGALHLLRETGSSGLQDMYPNPLTGAYPSTAAENFCGANDGAVVTRYDQVGVVDATQATTTKQPLMVESGTANDMPEHDGTDDFSRATGLVLDAYPYSPFCWCRANNTSGTDTPFVAEDSVSANDKFFFQRDPGGQSRISNRQSANVDATGASFVADAISLIAGRCNTNLTSVSLNGETWNDVTTSITFATTLDRVDVGRDAGAQPWDGGIAESIIYKESKSEADKNSIFAEGGPVTA